MNNGQSQQAPVASAAAAATAAAQRTPMYQPSHIRNLPTLSDDEKNKYEAGLKGLWAKANNPALNPQEQNAAKQKIIEFSRMLIGKIQLRRSQQTQPGQQSQQAAQASQAQPSPTPARPQGVPTPQNQPQLQPQQASAQAQMASAQQTPANNAAMKTENGAAAAGPAANAQLGANAQRTPVPDHILTHVNKMTIRAPPAFADRPADGAKWVEDMRGRYSKALMTMESAKSKMTGLDNFKDERIKANNPLKEEEMKHYQARKDHHLKTHNDALKWAEGFRKTQAQVGSQAVANGAGASATAAQQSDVAQQGGVAAQSVQGTVQNASTPVNAAEMARNQQAAVANRAGTANGTATPAQQAARTANPPPPMQTPRGQQQQQRPMPKPDQIQPAAINTAVANAVGQAQSAGTPTQSAARVQTPQTQTPVTAAGPTRALSHSAAMSLANQRANNTPGSAAMNNQQSNTGTPVSAGVVNQNVMGSGVQQQQGHTHAHPTQQQPTIQSKLPIPKHLPEKSTAVPMGVSVGGGINTGRPTMSQGSGTLGGVMNQPSVPRVPSYQHEAEGDHVLSKKKLDELVRQVCGGSAEGLDANLLTPDVEEVRTTKLHQMICILIQP